MSLDIPVFLVRQLSVNKSNEKQFCHNMSITIIIGTKKCRKYAIPNSDFGKRLKSMNLYPLFPQTECPMKGYKWSLIDVF